MNYYRKDWILFQEVANEGGKISTDLLDVKSKIEDPETNKHVPFIEETENGYIVKVGKNEFHGTDKEHHTMFIEIQVDNKYFYRQNVDQDSKPVAEFLVPKGKNVKAVAFCNLHGLFEYTL